MTEIQSQRTYNQKVYDIGNNQKRYRIHLRHLHYKKAGVFEDIDTRLSFTNGKWGHEKASYIPEIPEYADDWFSFKTQYEGNDFTVLAKPLASHAQGIYHEAPDGSTYVIYPNAFSPNIDLKAYAYHGGIKKVICINKAPVDTSKDLTFDFQLVLPPNTKVKDVLSKAEWDIKNSVDFKGKTITLGDTKGLVYFRNAKMWDSSGKSKSVDIQLYKQGSEIFLRKTIKAAILQEITYPLYTDHPTTYYAGAGDGYCWDEGPWEWSAQTTWDTVHDATVASPWADDGSVYTTATCEIGWRIDRQTPPSSGKYAFIIFRGFYPVDTSGIGDGDTISSATFNVYVTAVTNDENDGTDYLNVVQTTQASDTELVDEDYDLCGAVNNPTTGATAIDLGSLSTSAYNAFTLDATGRGWIDKTSYTNLGLRAGHDAEDELPGSTTDDQKNMVTTSTSEETGTSQDPYLDVTIAASGWTHKINSVAAASMSKVSGVAKSNIAKINQT